MASLHQMTACCVDCSKPFRTKAADGEPFYFQCHECRGVAVKAGPAPRSPIEILEQRMMEAERRLAVLEYRNCQIDEELLKTVV